MGEVITLDDWRWCSLGEKAAAIIREVDDRRSSWARATQEETRSAGEVRHWTGETERGSRVAVARHGAQCVFPLRVSQRTMV